MYVLPLPAQNFVTRRECTLEGSEFPWCAVEVDATGHLVDGRWGKCDMATCPEPAGGPDAAAASHGRSLTLTFTNLAGMYCTYNT